MNEQRSFERLLADRIKAEPGSLSLPDTFYDDFRHRAGGVRQRPRWLALTKEPPMRVSSRVAAGSPTARMVAIASTVLLLALATGAVVAGASYLASDRPLIVDPQDPSAYRTISDAVAAAADGDTVLVRPGRYAESVAIRSDITLLGDGERGSVVIEFASPEEGPSYIEGGEPDGEPFGYGILFEGSDAHVSNLSIQGPPDDGSGPAVSAVYVDGGAPVIEGIDVVLSGDRWTYSGSTYYRRSAVRITGGSAATIRDSTWDGYVRIFGEPNAPTFEGNTITGHHISIVDGGQEPVIRGNTLLEGAALRWQEGGSGGIAEDNEITGWISIDAANDPIIRGNRIREGGDLHAGSYAGTAIGIAGDATLLVEANEIEDSAIGIYLTGPGGQPDIQGNTIRGMSNTGIRVASGGSPSIDGNTIEDSAVGVTVVGTSTPTLSGNTFCGNEQDLVAPEVSGVTLDGNTICET
jgi:parallel beta-helix repeat protein